MVFSSFIYLSSYHLQFKGRITTDKIKISAKIFSREKNFQNLSMSVACLSIPMGNECCGFFDRSSSKSKTLFSLSRNSRRSISLTTFNRNAISTKTSSILLYKPIYIARYAQENLETKFAYDVGDEFELIEKLDEDFLLVLHLRTNTQMKLHRQCLYLDSQTPLRLAVDDRGIIQRCLFQYSVHSAYLIRRSKNEPNAFVLSISQISSQRKTEDWHYLIRINPINHQFYFAQQTKINHLSFSSFQNLIQHETIRRHIPLGEILPFQIDFEEDLWHIPKRNLVFEQRIGKGEFGEVWRASWKNGNRIIPVAVKRLDPLRQNQIVTNSFIREIETMKTLRHNYIVALYGIAQDFQTNETLLVTELMEDGDLKQWLKSSSKGLSEQTIVSFAFDICRGMAFLEQRSRVHRDLACRNLLLDEKNRTIKIADFGLSTIVNKDDFQRRKEACVEKLPVRWTAPEVLFDPTAYSSQSDVWSFGIVLIEIWLKGADPYPDEKDFISIRTLVQNGYVHKKPQRCPKQFYNRLILPCLAFQACQRPTFKSLVEILRHWTKEKAEYDRLNNIHVEFTI